MAPGAAAGVQVPPIAAPEVASNDDEFRLGLAQALRDATRSAIAGGLLGVAVLGVGGRIVMRLAALLHPETVGVATENGNRIGAITLDGTVALVLFGGLLFGLMASIVWIAVGPWIPGRRWRRGVLAAPVAVALSGVFLIEGHNPDFRILDGDPVVIAILIGLIAIFGLAFPVLDEWLDRRLPAARASRGVMAAYGAPVAIGSLLYLPFAAGSYFSRDFCFCPDPPMPIGLAILVAGGATVAWWVARTRGSPKPPPAVVVVGRLAVVAGVAVGTLLLAGQVTAILERG